MVVGVRHQTEDEHAWRRMTVLPGSQVSPDSRVLSSNSCRDTNFSLSRLPVHPLSSLCRLEHDRLQVLRSQDGQRYLLGCSEQTSHADAEATPLGATSSADLSDSMRGRTKAARRDRVESANFSTLFSRKWTSRASSDTGRSGGYSRSAMEGAGVRECIFEVTIL